mmetsp:Transcript_4767/g.7669  ORF Transcript_4767/g.7669 Transcript_4767/m.7669 type:complete len:211 (+) Transcript_4767:157-789(+)
MPMQGLVGKDGINVSKLLVDHKSKNTHLRRTSVIKLNRPLVQLILITQLIPPVINRTITVITGEFSLHTLRPSCLPIHNLRNGKEGDHLPQNILSIDALGVQGGEGCESIGNVLAAGESESGGCGEVSCDGEHGHASVFDFYFSETIELFLGFVGEEAKGVEESQRSHGAELSIEFTSDGTIHATLLSGSEGSGRADKGEKGGNFHHGVG